MTFEKEMENIKAENNMLISNLKAVAEETTALFQKVEEVVEKTHTLYMTALKIGWTSPSEVVKKDGMENAGQFASTKKSVLYKMMRDL